MKKKIVLVSLALALLLLPLLANHAVAKPFYQGKTIKLIVATKPGGGYDFYGRLVARFMQKYLPGSTIIVKNIPGAGHIIGCNTIYNAKPDGLTFGIFNRALPLAQVAGLKGVKYDLAKMTWLGSASSEVYSLVTTKKFRNVEDLRKSDGVKFSSAGIGSLSHVAAELFKEMTGIKNIKLITGYGGGEAELAMMRGELDGQFGSWNTMGRPFVEAGHGVPLLFIGKKQPKGYEEVPLLQDIVGEEKYKPVVDFLLTINILGRPFAGPPGMSKDRTKILRDAFAKACEDKELLRIAEKSENPIVYTDGDEALRMVESLLHLSPEVIKSIKQAYGKK
jgi:tripartite-type tricarboxylate transporter receptor subunit TctC